VEKKWANSVEEHAKTFGSWFTTAHNLQIVQERRFKNFQPLGKVETGEREFLQYANGIRWVGVEIPDRGRGGRRGTMNNLTGGGKNGWGIQGENKTSVGGKSWGTEGKVIPLDN